MPKQKPAPDIHVSTAVCRTPTSAKPRRMTRQPKQAETAALAHASDASSGAPAANSPRTNKQSLVLELLRSPSGATLDDLIAATGWLPHSTRAALTGLRKKGHAVERIKIDERTAYRIAGGEA